MQAHVHTTPSPSPLSPPWPSWLSPSGPHCLSPSPIPISRHPHHLPTLLKRQRTEDAISSNNKTGQTEKTRTPQTTNHCPRQHRIRQTEPPGSSQRGGQSIPGLGAQLLSSKPLGSRARTKRASPLPSSSVERRHEAGSSRFSRTSTNPLANLCSRDTEQLSFIRLAQTEWLNVVWITDRSVFFVGHQHQASSACVRVCVNWQAIEAALLRRLNCLVKPAVCR